MANGTPMLSPTITPPSNIRGELRRWYEITQGEKKHYAGFVYGDSTRRLRDGHRYYTGTIVETVDKTNENWKLIEDNMGNRWLLWRDKRDTKK